MRRTRVEEACSERNFRAWSRRAFWSAEKSKFTAEGSYGIRGRGATGGWGSVVRPERLPRVVDTVLRQEDDPAGAERALPVAAELRDGRDHSREGGVRVATRPEEIEALESRALHHPDESQSAGADLAGLDGVAIARHAFPLPGARLSAHPVPLQVQGQ